MAPLRSRNRFPLCGDTTVVRIVAYRRGISKEKIRAVPPRPRPTSRPTDGRSADGRTRLQIPTRKSDSPERHLEAARPPPRSTCASRRFVSGSSPRKFAAMSLKRSCRTVPPYPFVSTTSNISPRRGTILDDSTASVGSYSIMASLPGRCTLRLTGAALPSNPVSLGKPREEPVHRGELLVGPLKPRRPDELVENEEIRPA